MMHQWTKIFRLISTPIRETMNGRWRMMMFAYTLRGKFEYQTIYDQVVDIVNAGIKK